MKSLPKLVRFFPAKGEDKMDFDIKFLACLERVPISTDHRDTLKTQQLLTKLFYFEPRLQSWYQTVMKGRYSAMFISWKRL